MNVAGSPARSSAPRFNTVRNRLVALFFVISSAAIGFVYLYVVPQLDSSLTAEKLRRLEDAAGEATRRLGPAAGDFTDLTILRRRVRGLAEEADARVTLLGLPADGPAFVLADSELEVTALKASYPVARAAGRVDQVRSGIELVDGVRYGETAIPIFRSGEPIWTAVLSTSLSDVDSNVALIRRQILIAGAIAILASLAAGWYASGAHSRRLRRLEAAAQQVAEGNFGPPIPVGNRDEVGQLAETFNEMQERLSRLDRARSEFIANASHELRTPVFSLGGFMEILAEEDLEPTEREEFLKTMRQQVERLRHLTVDLLDLSKLDAGVIEIDSEPVPLGSVARQIEAEFLARARAHDSTIQTLVSTEREPLVQGDSRRVAQILRILLDNALTHTPKGTKIKISVDQVASQTELAVTDDGAGIGPDDRARVFDRFYSGDSVSGSGLGLAIARELAARMGGDLRVSSRRGDTRFTLALESVGSSDSPGQDHGAPRSGR